VRNVFTARRTAALLVLAVAYYTFVIGSRAVTLLGDRRLAFRGLGVGLLLLALVGVALVAAEVRFGAGSQRLARLRGPDAPPRRTQEEADAAFDSVQAAVEAAPEDWRAWYDLALAYADARDPRRGRAAMRRAIALERAAR
jgi:cytochrome c-type biogenesis protein CcmH/NrfG